LQYPALFSCKIQVLYQEEFKKADKVGEQEKKSKENTKKD